MVVWWCFCGGGVLAVVFLWWCGGVFVAVWWCGGVFCGGVFVVMFLCWCGVVFVAVFFCFWGCVLVVVFILCSTESYGCRNVLWRSVVKKRCEGVAKWCREVVWGIVV